MSRQQEKKTKRLPFRSKHKVQPSETGKKYDIENTHCRDAASYVLPELGEERRRRYWKLGAGPYSGRECVLSREDGEVPETVQKTQ